MGAVAQLVTNFEDGIQRQGSNPTEIDINYNFFNLILLATLLLISSMSVNEVNLRVSYLPTFSDAESLGSKLLFPPAETVLLFGYS